MVDLPRDKDMGRSPYLSYLIHTVISMAEDHIWTAAELERMTPEEQQRLFDEAVVKDLSQVDPEFLERVRAHGRALLEERGLIAPRDDDG
jgi:hypothetical protein